MRDARHPGVRLAIVLAVVLAAAMPGLAREAAAGVESVLDVGGTFAIAGQPDNGGVSLGLSFMWPLEEHFRVGVTGTADELGNVVNQLTGPNGEDLGPVSGGARYTWGAGARFEAHARSRGAYDPFALLTWGIQTVQDDLRGVPVNTEYAASIGLGAGLVRVINPQHAVGLVLRGQWLTRGEADRFLSAAVEWRWGWKGAGHSDATGSH